MYNILYHKLVFEEDFKKIPKKDWERIVRDINKKLAISPELFGKPLRYELKGYWKLRIGDYRTIYRINKQEITILVIKIGPRRNMAAYLSAAKRLGLI